MIQLVSVRTNDLLSKEVGATRTCTASCWEMGFGVLLDAMTAPMVLTPADNVGLQPEAMALDPKAAQAAVQESPCPIGWNF
jgi:hypothetical protein